MLRSFSDHWVAVPVTVSNAPMVALNKVGAFVWQLLQVDMSFQEALTKLTEHYDVDEATARRDLELFIQIADDAGVLIR